MATQYQLHIKYFYKQQHFITKLIAVARDSRNTAGLFIIARATFCAYDFLGSDRVRLKNLDDRRPVVAGRD